MNRHLNMHRPSGHFYTNLKTIRMLSLALMPVVAIAVFLLLSHRAEAANKFWVASSTGNFSDDANWSLTSGGPANTTAPGPSDTVFFDANGLGNCTITANASVESLTIGSGYSGAITVASGVTVTVGGSGFSQSGGTFNGGNSDIDINGNFLLQGTGVFNSTTGTLFLGSAFDHNTSTNPGGTFNHNNGTVTFDGSFGGISSELSGTVFNNVNFNHVSQRVVFNTQGGGPTMTVLGELALNDGQLFGNRIEARGSLLISPDFDGAPVNHATLVIANGSGPRTITFAAGTNMLNVILNDPNATIQTSGSGTLAWRTLTLQAGTINQGGVSFAFPPDGTGTYTQSGGAFNAAANLIAFQSEFNQSGGTFNGGSGDIDVGLTFTLSGSGVFTSTSGTLFLGAAYSHDSGGAFNHNNGSVVFDGAGNGVYNLPIAGETFNNVSFSLPDGGQRAIFGGPLIALSTLTLNNGTIFGGTLQPQGNMIIANTFDGGVNTTVTFSGSNNQTFTNNGGVNPSGAWTIDKASGKVTLLSNLILGTGQPLNVTSGTLDLGASFNLTAGSITIGASGTLRNFGTGNLTLGGDLTNNGIFNFNGGQTACGDPNVSDQLLIRSSAEGSARSWSGTGAFSIVDVDVKDQNATSVAGGITAFTSIDSGNNSNWTFSSSCPVEVTTDPENQSGCSGGQVSFTVAASGTGLTFQWRKGGVNLSDGGNISGATTDTLTINPTQAGDAGSYDVIVANSFGVTDTSGAATLTLQNTTAINQHPSNAVRCEGESVTFTVSASGTALSFQWRKGGIDIAGAASSSFTIDPVEADDGGSYDVVVTGACGVQTSNPAVLTVNTLPSITAQPANQTVCGGSVAMFTATADAIPAATVQWQVSTDAEASFNNIAGATNNTLSFTASGSQNGNRYRAVFSNGCGTATSSAATLTVNVFTLSRAHRSFPGGAGADTIDVTVAAECGWTAESDQEWITITAGSPGDGNGTVSYTVVANPGNSIRSGTISIADQTFRVFQGIDFTDVPVGNLFYNEIGRLSARSVTLGCGGGNFCPDQPVTREQMAAFIIRAIGVFDPPPPTQQRFLDVPPSNPFYAFIEELAVRQITLGCGGGNYCPSDPVLREQMAAFIMRGLGEFDPPEPAMQRFLDVPPSNTFYRFIDRMAVLQITLGCGGGNYCPTQSVTRAQMAAFLVRAFNL